MTRQASEIRLAVPYLGLADLEDALDLVSLEVTVEGEVISDFEARDHRLRRDAFLTAEYRLLAHSHELRSRVARAAADAGIDVEAISFLCYAIAPTLKQTRLLMPSQDDGRVPLTPVSGQPGDELRIDAEGASHLFRDVAGFQVTYGFVLNRYEDASDPLHPRYKATWLARRTQRVGVASTPRASYELHPLTPDLRRVFELDGRPLFYVKQSEEAVSPLFTRDLHDVIEIYVDDDILPRLQATRPGAATRYIAAQIASQVYTTVIQLGGADLDSLDDEKLDDQSVFARAVRFLGGETALEALPYWLASDPGRIDAEVQMKMAAVEQAESLLT